MKPPRSPAGIRPADERPRPSSRRTRDHSRVAEILARRRSVRLRVGADCYWPDGTDDHGSFVGTRVDFVEFVQESLARFERTAHFLGNVLIDADLAGDVARAETYAVAFHRYTDSGGRPTDMWAGLRYVDRFERRNGEWRIKTRVCAFEWRRTDPVEGEGGFADGYVLGLRSRDDIVFHIRRCRASCRRRLRHARRCPCAAQQRRRGQAGPRLGPHPGRLVLGDGRGAYAAAKSAVLALSMSLQTEFEQCAARLGVSVLCPGFIATDITSSARNRPGQLANETAAPDVPRTTHSTVATMTAPIW